MSTQVVSSSCNDQERYLCLIEKEAVVHVLLECVSSNLDPINPQLAHEVSINLHHQLLNTYYLLSL